jgi:hypothetical protein
MAPFEATRHEDENGEYWSERELSPHVAGKFG